MKKYNYEEYIDRFAPEAKKPKISEEDKFRLAAYNEYERIMRELRLESIRHLYPHLNISIKNNEKTNTAS